jgi:hypothetical protein
MAFRREMLNNHEEQGASIGRRPQPDEPPFSGK